MCVLLGDTSIERETSPVMSVNMLKIISRIHSRKNTMIMIKLLVLIMSKLLLVVWYYSYFVLQSYIGTCTHTFSVFTLCE